MDTEQLANHLPSADDGHTTRYIRTAEWLMRFMGAIGNGSGRVMVELGRDTRFSKMIRSLWPDAHIEDTGTQDLRGPLAVANGFADLVLCMEVIEHVKDLDSLNVDDIERFWSSGILAMLRSAYHILKPGGVLFLSTPNVTCWHCIDRLFRQEHPYFYNMHTRELAPSDVRNYLIDTGFVVERLETVNVWGFHTTPKSRVEELRQIAVELGYSSEDRNDCIFCLARKP